MNTIEERLADDDRLGDLGMSRQRLRSQIHAHGYDAITIQQIARLSIRMNDLYEAGRWYYIVDSKDERAAEMIAHYRKRCHGDRQAACNIPFRGRIQQVEGLSEVVRARLGPFVKLPPRPVAVPPSVARRSIRDRTMGVLVIVVGVLVLAAFTLCLALGVGVIVGWIGH